MRVIALAAAQALAVAATLFISAYIIWLVFYRTPRRMPPSKRARLAGGVYRTCAAELGELDFALEAADMLKQADYWFGVADDIEHNRETPRPPPALARDKMTGSMHGRHYAAELRRIKKAWDEADGVPYPETEGAFYDYILHNFEGICRCLDKDEDGPR